jgi:uncharacterized GH25 family protein
MNIYKKYAALALGFCLSFSAHAHRGWMLPSATVLSGDAPWITVDAAISNDLFYFEHHAMRLDHLQISAPDGSALEAQNSSTGKYRSTFDLQLPQTGTYKLAVINEGLFARYTLNGETKRWRGTAENFAKEVPADAQALELTQSQGRVEVFVTAGKPSDKVLQPTGAGLELAPITHPNDLFAGERASFRLLLDGKPAAGVKVAIIPGGIRYRDQLKDINTSTDSEGRFNVTWPQPGVYWLRASVQDDKATFKGAKRRASYAVTLEVMPQ